MASANGFEVEFTSKANPDDMFGWINLCSEAIALLASRGAMFDEHDVCVDGKNYVKRTDEFMW